MRDEEAQQRRQDLAELNATLQDLDALVRRMRRAIPTARLLVVDRQASAQDRLAARRLLTTLAVLDR